MKKLFDRFTGRGNKAEQQASQQIETQNIQSAKDEIDKLVEEKESLSRRYITLNNLWGKREQTPMTPEDREELGSIINRTASLVDELNSLQNTLKYSYGVDYGPSFQRGTHAKDYLPK